MNTNLDLLLIEHSKRIEMLQKAVSAGNCSNYDEYKFACGQILGLESACLAITDLKTKLENSDE